LSGEIILLSCQLCNVLFGMFELLLLTDSFLFIIVVFHLVILKILFLVLKVLHLLLLSSLLLLLFLLLGSSWLSNVAWLFVEISFNVDITTLALLWLNIFDFIEFVQTIVVLHLVISLSFFVSFLLLWGPELLFLSSIFAHELILFFKLKSGLLCVASHWVELVVHLGIVHFTVEIHVFKRVNFILGHWLAGSWHDTLSNCLLLKVLFLLLLSKFFILLILSLA
jgi:hypothetical protein